ncbi:DUF6283 family protein [Vibrio sp.]|nr:DUF6283 family protein [Vibrio sp.]
MNLPNMRSPCKSCPFRKDSMVGWLGSERMEEILNQDRFVCHKTVDYESDNTADRKQCAGHMLLLKTENLFYRFSIALNQDLKLSGQELIFKSKQDCIEHHNN